MAGAMSGKDAIQPPICERDAARYIGMSVAYMRQARMHGRGPAYVKLGRSVRYFRADLDRFIADHRVEPRKKT